MILIFCIFVLNYQKKPQEDVKKKQYFYQSGSLRNKEVDAGKTYKSVLTVFGPFPLESDNKLTKNKVSDAQTRIGSHPRGWSFKTHLRVTKHCRFYTFIF